MFHPLLRWVLGVEKTTIWFGGPYYTQIRFRGTRRLRFCLCNPTVRSKDRSHDALYGAACIDNLVRSPDGTTLSPDVLMFNWGLRRPGTRPGWGWMPAHATWQLRYTNHSDTLLDMFMDAAQSHIDHHKC